MKLHQIKLDYDRGQDRLLLRISTDDRKEVLLWLTRRCVRLLWPLLVQAAQSDPRIASQSSAEARAALLEIEHERAVHSADFSRPYEAPRERPLGAEPLLVARMHSGKDARGNRVLSLAPIEGQGIDLTLDATLLHSLCRLLQQAVDETEWDLSLTLPQATVAAQELSGRTIN